jgi:bacterioferritin-associated ferredoxin
MVTHRLTHPFMLSRVGQRYLADEMPCQSACGACATQASYRLTEGKEEALRKN